MAHAIAFQLRRAVSERDAVGRPHATHDCDHDSAENVSFVRSLSSKVLDASRIVHDAVWGPLCGRCEPKDSRSIALPAFVEAVPATYAEWRHAPHAVGFVPIEDWQNMTCVRTSNPTDKPVVLAHMSCPKAQPYTSGQMRAVVTLEDGTKGTTMQLTSDGLALWQLLRHACAASQDAIQATELARVQPREGTILDFAQVYGNQSSTSVVALSAAATMRPMQHLIARSASKRTKIKDKFDHTTDVEMHVLSTFGFPTQGTLSVGKNGDLFHYSERTPTTFRRLKRVYVADDADDVMTSWVVEVVGAYNDGAPVLPNFATNDDRMEWAAEVAALAALTLFSSAGGQPPGIVCKQQACEQFLASYDRAVAKLRDAPADAMVKVLPLPSNEVVLVTTATWEKATTPTTATSSFTLASALPSATLSTPLATGEPVRGASHTVMKMAANLQQFHKLLGVSVTESADALVTRTQTTSVHSTAFVRDDVRVALLAARQGCTPALHAVARTQGGIEEVWSLGHPFQERLRNAPEGEDAWMKLDADVQGLRALLLKTSGWEDGPCGLVVGDTKLSHVVMVHVPPQQEEMRFIDMESNYTKVMSADVTKKPKRIGDFDLTSASYLNLALLAWACQAESAAVPPVGSSSSSSSLPLYGARALWDAINGGVLAAKEDATCSFPAPNLKHIDPNTIDMLHDRLQHYYHIFRSSGGSRGTAFNPPFPTFAVKQDETSLAQVLAWPLKPHARRNDFLRALKKVIMTVSSHSSAPSSNRMGCAQVQYDQQNLDELVSRIFDSLSNKKSSRVSSSNKKTSRVSSDALDDFLDRHTAPNACQWFSAPYPPASQFSREQFQDHVTRCGTATFASYERILAKLLTTTSLQWEYPLRDGHNSDATHAYTTNTFCMSHVLPHLWFELCQVAFPGSIPEAALLSKDGKKKEWIAVLLRLLPLPASAAEWTMQNRTSMERFPSSEHVALIQPEKNSKTTFANVKPPMYDRTKRLDEATQGILSHRSRLVTSDFISINSNKDGQTWHPFSEQPSHRFYVLSKPPNSNMTWHEDKPPGNEGNNKWGTVVYVILGPDEMSSIVHSFVSNDTKFLIGLDSLGIQVKPTEFTSYVKSGVGSKPSNLLEVYNNGVPSSVDDSKFQTQLRSADRPLKVRLTLPDELVEVIECPGRTLAEKRDHLDGAGLQHIAVVGERGSVLAFDGAELHGVENVAQFIHVTFTPIRDTPLCGEVNVPTLRDVELTEFDLHNGTETVLTVDGVAESKVELRYEWSSKARALSLAVWSKSRKSYVNVRQTLPLDHEPHHKQNVVEYVAVASFARPQIVLAINLPKHDASSSS